MLKNFSTQQKIFIVCAMLCGFLISAEYAIIRPASNSLFIHAHGAKSFPYAWLALVPLSLLLVHYYNRYLSKIGVFRMFLSVTLSVMLLDLLGPTLFKNVSWFPFAYYVWKEIYIMLMFQQLWSVIHAKVQFKEARYLYGIFFGIGGLGASLGSMVPGFFSVTIGSENLLYFGLPIYLVLIATYSLLLKSGEKIDGSQQLSDQHTNEHGSLRTGLELIRGSRLLLFILSLVVFMQLATTIIDFQFQTLLEHSIPMKDLRTAYTGKLISIVNFVTMGLQLFGTYLVIQVLGARRTHFILPSIFCLNAVSFFFFPLFGLASFSIATLKAADFSLFSVIKEMLYIPLSLDEKFHAKAIIDVFAYRSSKALGAMLILALSFQVLAAILVALFIGWIYMVSRAYKHIPVTQNA